MEQRKYNLRPLPGGRRGASGADAGCHSMRTVGDGGLSMRVPLEKLTTADRSSSPSSTSASETSPFSNIPSPSSSNSLFNVSLSPSSSYSSQTTWSTIVVQEATATEPAPNVDPIPARKKWTDEMNRFIWRTYLLITNRETALLNNYLEPLHQAFTHRYPEMRATRQRIGDQRRAILRRKLLSQNTIDEINTEVRETTQMNTQSHSYSIHLPPSLHTQAQTNTTPRMKWSKEMNEDIIRCYYEVTELETNKTAYRRKLYERFIEKYPHLSSLTEQRVADQRRQIFSNKKISTNRFEELRRESELNQIQSANQFEPNIALSIEDTPRLSNSENIIDVQTLLQTASQTCTFNIDSPNPSEIQSSEIETNDIALQFEESLTRFKMMNPESRPRIPRQKSSRKFSQIICYLNEVILPKYLTTELDFESLHTIIYSAAFTAALCNGTRFSFDTNRNNQNNKPTWQRRMEQKIEQYRQEIGRLTQYIAGNRSHKVVKSVEKIKHKYNTHSQHEEPNTDLEHFLDTLKQKLNATSNRLKRYLTCTNRKKQNCTFATNEKLFYRNLGQQSNLTLASDIPSPHQLQQFWADIWENPIQHNENPAWLHKTADTTHIAQMCFEDISIEMLTEVITRTHNWKAPGTDKIHNYWYKKLTCTHKFIHKYINQFIQSPHIMPTFITHGVTYMLPKGSDPKNPANYRPITCLQTIYKIITGCISEIIYKHLDQYNILAEQQKGCRKNSQGCKEQLTIDAIDMKQAQTKHRNIHTMYIDYKKAFDSVPHSWLLFILEHYKIHPNLVSFIKTAMGHWETKLQLFHNNASLTTEPIKIQRGIFQGDALSPLWFCMAINPLSELLNSTNTGFKLKHNNTHHTLSHLMYMDDIKIYATNNTELTKLADITQSFSSDIHMLFGIDKCKTHSITKGKSVSNAYTLNTGEQIDPLDENSTYKYLGFHQSKQIHQTETKSQLTKKFKIRLNQILRSCLNSRNTVKAINTYAIPTLTYSFGVIKWSQTDLTTLQRIVNTHMTTHRKHHPKSCVQRLTLPRRDGGRGLIDIKNLHNTIVNKLRHYFHTKAENTALHQYIVNIDNKLTPLNLHDRNTQPSLHLSNRQQKLDMWSQKSLHGRHLADLSQAHVDKGASNEWLRRGELFPETEAFMIAIQDQVIDTRNYQKFIMRVPNLLTDLCRRCHSSSETIQHITGACKAIVQTDYKHRHDQVAAIVHQNIAHKYGFINKKVAYYKYKPNPVLENDRYKVYWDRTIITDKTIHYNRPDITILDKTNKKVSIVDIAVCNTHNIITTHTEKMSKYIDLSIEIKRQWQIDTVRILPIVISTTGVVPNTLQTHLNTLQMPKSTLTLLQKAAILNTCRLTRKFLSSSTSSL